MPPLSTLTFPQTGLITSPKYLHCKNCGQTAADSVVTAYRNLTTPYPTVPSPIPYRQLLSENRGPDPLPPKKWKIARCHAVRSAILTTAALFVLCFCDCTKLKTFTYIYFVFLPLVYFLFLTVPLFLSFTDLDWLLHTGDGMTCGGLTVVSFSCPVLTVRVAV